MVMNVKRILVLIAGLALTLPAFSENLCPTDRPLSCSVPGEFRNCDSEPGVLSRGPTPICFCPEGYTFKHPSLFCNNDPDPNCATFQCVPSGRTSKGSPPQTSQPPSPSPEPSPTPVQKVEMAKEAWENCINPERSLSACTSIIGRSDVTDSDRAVAHTLLAGAHSAKGDERSALEDCNRAIRADHEIYIAYARRADIYMHLENYAKAIEDYTSAINLEPKFSSKTNYQAPYKLDLYYGSRAQAYNNIRNPWKALPDATKAIESTPSSHASVAARSYWNRGLANEALYKRDQAIADYRRALAMNSGLSFVERDLERAEAAPPPSVSDACVELGTPRPAGVGCAPGKEWYWTPVSVRRMVGCPSSIEVEYLAPDSNKIEEMSAPTRLQTCGEGVSVVRVKQ